MRGARDPGPEAVERILEDMEQLRMTPAEVARQARRIRAHIDALTTASQEKVKTGAVPEGQTPEHRSSPSTDEELIGKLRLLANGGRFPAVPILIEAADRLESLLSDRAKLEERIRALEDLRDLHNIMLVAEDDVTVGHLRGLFGWEKIGLKDERA